MIYTGKSKVHTWCQTNLIAAKMLASLKQEITCPLCLDVFKHPKKLPCDHVYCQDCLCRLALAKKQADGSISCPECRTPAQVSSEDCSNFYTPFHINRLIEIYENGVREEGDNGTAVSRVSEDVQRGKLTISPTCPAHRAQPLSLYCETCEKLVCRDCIMFSCAKLQHSYGYIEDMLEKHKSALSTSLFKVVDLQQRMKDTLDLTGKFATNIDKEEAKVVGEVDASFARLFDILRDEKSTLAAKMKAKFQDARTHNSAKRDEVAAVCSKLEKVMSSENPSRNGSGTESGTSFLAELKARKAAIQEVIQAALAVERPDPVELPDTEFSVIKPDKLQELCKSSIFTSDRHNSLKCHFEGSLEWNNVPLQYTSFITLCVDTQIAIPKLKAHLYCLYSKKKYPVSVNMDTSAHILAIRPQERGRHELHVKHNNVHVSESPVQLNVALGFPLHRLELCTLGQFSHPMGIKCAGEFVCVSELGSGLALLKPRTLERVLTIKLPGIWEVYVDFKSNRLYGTDNRQHTLKVMTMEGQVLKCIGGKGNTPGKFCWPNGIRCSEKGELYVCDTMNNRLQVFDKGLNYLRAIDSPVLATPDDLDFDEEGKLYVANQGSHNIIVLSPDGTYHRTIGTAGTQLGELCDPISVAVHNKLVYVTDNGNRRISVFTTAGEFVNVFGEGTLVKPECIAVDRDGYIYVTDNRSKVFVF